MYDYPNSPHRAGQGLDPDDPPMMRRSPTVTRIEKKIETLQQALDTLGAALADHGHQWTSEERQLYERATTILRGNPRKWIGTPLANAPDEPTQNLAATGVIRVVSVGKADTPEAAAAAHALIGATLHVMAIVHPPTPIKRKEGKESTP